MAEYTANALQTVGVNQNVLLTDEPVKGNCSIIHRDGSGLVTLRGITNQCRARFRVYFNGNIAIPTGGTVGPISLAISINGEPVASSTMIVTPAPLESSLMLVVVYLLMYLLDVALRLAQKIQVLNQLAFRMLI